MAIDINKPLRTCPKCGAKFVQKNIWHSCGKFTLEDFLKGKSERGIELFYYFLNEYKKIGTIILHPVKTRVAFMVKVRFSGVRRIGKDFIEGGFWLKGKYKHPKFHKIEKYTDNDFGHYFKIYNESDIDVEFRKFMKMAYEIGERKHLNKKRRSALL